MKNINHNYKTLEKVKELQKETETKGKFISEMNTKRKDTRA